MESNNSVCDCSELDTLYMSTVFSDGNSDMIFERQVSPSLRCVNAFFRSYMTYQTVPLLSFNFWRTVHRMLIKAH